MKTGQNTPPGKGEMNGERVSKGVVNPLGQGGVNAPPAKGPLNEASKTRRRGL